MLKAWQDFCLPRRGVACHARRGLSLIGQALHRRVKMTDLFSAEADQPWLTKRVGRGCLPASGGSLPSRLMLARLPACARAGAQAGQGDGSRRPGKSGSPGLVLRSEGFTSQSSRVRPTGWKRIKLPRFGA